MNDECFMLNVHLDESDVMSPGPGAAPFSSPKHKHSGIIAYVAIRRFTVGLPVATSRPREVKPVNKLQINE